MAYLIQTTEHPGTAQTRAQLRAEHLRYLDAHKHLLLVAGARLDEATGEALGSSYALDVDTREEAEGWIATEPFAAGGIVADTLIVPLRVAFVGRESLIEIPPATE